MDLSWKERFETSNEYHHLPRLRSGTCTHCKKEKASGVSIEMISGNVGYICSDCVRKLVKR